MLIMDVSVIIVNYNTLRMTAECIDSIIEKTHGITYEIILVDNGSKDGSKEFFEKDNRIKYIYSNENLGFGRANNLGTKYAKGRNILFLNSDTLLLNNAIKILSDTLNSNDYIGVCGGNLFSADLKPTHSFERNVHCIFNELNILSRYRLSNLLYGANSEFNNNSSLLQVDYICGADLMIRHDLFNDIGGFCNEYFMYFEETDLCHCVRDLGYKIVSVPTSKIIHLEGASFKDSHLAFNYNKWEMMLKSKKTYYTRHFCPVTRYLAFKILKYNLIVSNILRKNKSYIDYKKLCSIYDKNL